MLKPGMRGEMRKAPARQAPHWSVPVVLAMLGLRALVPAGFMLAPVDGRPAVVLCDSDATASLHQHDQRAGHDHSRHHHHQHPDPTCPYAQSSGPAPLPTLPVLTQPVLAEARALSAQSAQTHALPGPTRLHSSRGPPALA